MSVLQHDQLSPPLPSPTLTHVSTDVPPSSERDFRTRLQFISWWRCPAALNPTPVPVFWPWRRHSGAINNQSGFFSSVFSQTLSCDLKFLSVERVINTWRKYSSETVQKSSAAVTPDRWSTITTDTCESVWDPPDGVWQFEDVQKRGGAAAVWVLISGQKNWFFLMESGGVQEHLWRLWKYFGHSLFLKRRAMKNPLSWEAALRKTKSYMLHVASSVKKNPQWRL